jgi:pimeloyl-ACP methyl ester carboxylesterase
MMRSLGTVLGTGPQRLGDVRQPTLLVWRRLRSEFPNARLIELDRCGHLPMLEQPERFNEAVAEFLATATIVPAGSCSAA